MIDLVRLVTSFILAKRQNELAIDAEHAAEAVLEGYTQWLETGGDPFHREESRPGLRAMAMSAERDPIKFWSNLKDSPQLEPPKRVRRLLDQSLPGGLSEIRFLHRVAGIGSLGRPRYVEVACCNGGKIAREVKAWLPSAWGWAKGSRQEARLFGANAQARSAAARSLLFRRGWVGASPHRPTLRATSA